MNINFISYFYLRIYYILKLGMQEIEIFEFLNINNIDLYQFYKKYEEYKTNNIYIDSESDEE